MVLAKPLASTNMKRIYVIAVLTLFVYHQSKAQIDSTRILNLPFSSFMKVSNDSSILIERQDSLDDWKQIEIFNSTKKWKLIGLKIFDFGYHAGFSEGKTISKTNYYITKDFLPTINTDTLAKYFELSEPTFLTEWTSFQCNNLIIISKRDRFIGNMYDFTTVFEYYFEEKQ
ncbi:MAG: hypothetical protein ACI9Z7_001174 [Alteromonas macleodii]